MLHSPAGSSLGSGGILHAPQRTSFASSSHDEWRGSSGAIHPNGRSKDPGLNVAVRDDTRVHEDHLPSRQGNDAAGSRYSLTTLHERANEKLQAALNVLPEIARTYLSEEEEGGRSERHTSVSSESAALPATTGRSSPTVHEKDPLAECMPPRMTHTSLLSPRSLVTLDHKGETKPLNGNPKVSSSSSSPSHFYSPTTAPKALSPSSGGSVFGLQGSSPTVPKGVLSGPPPSLTHTPTALTSPTRFAVPTEDAHQVLAKGPQRSVSGALGSAADASGQISWKCGLCAYHMLAVDQFGQPLPLACNAYGDCIPLRCPRCHLEHTSWVASSPFDRQGEHINLRSTLSSHQQLLHAPLHLERGTTVPSLSCPSTGTTTLANSPAFVGEDVQPSSSTIDAPTASSTSPLQGKYAVLSASQPNPLSPHSSSPSRVELPPILASIGKKRHIHREGGQPYPHVRGSLSSNYPCSSTSRKGMGAYSSGSRRAFYCGLCGRRLLRVDSDGELVAMDLNDEGQVRPLRCPGCHEVHSKWMIKPFVANERKGEAT